MGNDNNRASIFLNEGDKLLEEGKFDDAIIAYSKAIDINPIYADALFKRGLAYSNLGNYKKAIEDFNKAIKINPKFTQALVNRGIAYSNLYNHKKENYNKAIKDYPGVIQIDPNYVVMFLNLSSVCVTLKKNKKVREDFKKAIEDFNKAIKINPSYTDAFLVRGIAYSDLCGHKKAIEDCNKVIQINPNDDKAFLVRGITYCNLGKYKEAIEDFNKAIDINPNYFEVFLIRGIAYNNLGKYKEAIENFNKTRKKKGYYYGCSKLIAHIAFAINNFIEELDFIKTLDLIEELDLNNIEKIELLSYIFLFQSRYKINSQDKEDKEDKYIYHYTKKDTLQKILDSKEFHLTPSFTLNDPEEGTAFYNSIDLEKDKIINENDNLVFIQSFTKTKDNLPMYIMYSTEEKDKNQMGYCIGYETSLFRGYGKKKV